MSPDRGTAHASITGDGELSACGRLMALITLTLADPGPVTLDDGTQVRHGDISCLLRPNQALLLAEQLARLALATHEQNGGLW